MLYGQRSLSLKKHKTVSARQPNNKERKKVASLKKNSYNSKSKTLDKMSMLKPATSYESCSLNEPVKLRGTEESLVKYKPKTIPDFFHECCEKYRNLPALAYETSSTVQENGNCGKATDTKWITVTYGEYEEHVEQVAKALLYLGVPARSSVGVIAYNCPQWFYVEMAAFQINAVTVGVYTTNTAEAVFHVLDSADTSVVVVDNTQQLDKVRAIKSRLAKLRAVIQLNGPFDFTEEEKANGFYSWADLIQRDYDDDLAEQVSLREREVAANDCALLIYTSGTVGRPKGCMLSHDGVLFCANAMASAVPIIVEGTESVVSFLPLNHIAAQIADIFVAIGNGGLVYFADRNALKGTLIKTYQKARATFISGVPRVFEKMREKILQVENSSSTVMRFICTTARNAVLQYNLDRLEGRSTSYLKYWLASKITTRIKTAMGFDRAKMALIGAAPVTQELKRFFLSLDLPLVEAYGMSESSGAIVINFYKPHLKTLGTPVAGQEIKIREPDHNGEGEILLRGRTNMMGYLKEPEKTNETLTQDGWLQTGDVGYIDEEGNVFITGRIKELIITAGGENIPPVPIEYQIKKELPCLSNAMVIGDHRKYLTVLLTFKTHIDPDTGYPLDTLLPETKEWLESLGLSYTHLSEMLQIQLPENLKDFDPTTVEVQLPEDIEKALTAGIKRANEHAMSNAQKVQYFTVLPHDLSIPTQELGPTLKLRRNIVHKKYEKLIDKMYKN